MLLSLIGVGSVSANTALSGGLNNKINVSNSIYLGSNITGANFPNPTIVLNIPSQYNTVAFNATTSPYFVSDVYCDDFIANSTGLVYNDTPQLSSTLFITMNLNYHPKVAGRYIVGAICQYTSDSFVNGTWQGWTQPIEVANITTSVNVYTPPATPPPPPSISSITNFFSGIFNWLQNLLSSI